MKMTGQFIKQFLIMVAVMGAGLVVLNGFGLNIAFAQGAISTEQDQPAIIRQLSGDQTGFRGIVLAIVNFFLTFLGLLAVVMIIYGGFLYVGSAGNEEAVGKAKKILMYAVIGIVIIIVSFALVNTILGAASPERPQ